MNKLWKNHDVNGLLQNHDLDRLVLDGVNNRDSFLMILLDLQRKVNEIHRLLFAEQHLPEKKQRKERFLAEILISRTRNVNRKVKNREPHDR